MRLCLLLNKAAMPLIGEINMFGFLNKKPDVQPSERTQRVLKFVEESEVCHINLKIIATVPLRRDNRELEGSSYVPCDSPRLLSLTRKSIEGKVEAPLILRAIRNKIGDIAGSAVDTL